MVAAIAMIVYRSSPMFPAGSVTTSTSSVPDWYFIRAVHAICAVPLSSGHRLCYCAPDSLAGTRKPKEKPCMAIDCRSRMLSCDRCDFAARRMRLQEEVAT